MSRSTIIGNSKAQRQAWDNTMREEVGVTSIPGQAPIKRHTTRAVKDRAASSSVKKHNVHGGINELEFKRLARLERLELTNAWDPLERSNFENIVASDDSSNDDDGDDDSRQYGNTKKRKRSEKKFSNNIKKQFFLSDVILSEGLNDFVKSQVRKSIHPCPIHVCDVTGKEGHYRDPLTGLWVHDRRSIVFLREQVPSWLKSTAISPYWDAIKTLQQQNDNNEDELNSN